MDRFLFERLIIRFPQLNYYQFFFLESGISLLDYKFINIPRFLIRVFSIKGYFPSASYAFGIFSIFCRRLFSENVQIVCFDLVYSHFRGKSFASDFQTLCPFKHSNHIWHPFPSLVRFLPIFGGEVSLCLSISFVFFGESSSRPKDSNLWTS